MVMKEHYTSFEALEHKNAPSRRKVYVVDDGYDEWLKIRLIGL